MAVKGATTSSLASIRQTRPMAAVTSRALKGSFQQLVFPSQPIPGRISSWAMLASSRGAEHSDCSPAPKVERKQPMMETQ